MTTAPPGVKERPIMFKLPMVRAILDGTKTQTRRVAKLRRGQEVEHGAIFKKSDPFAMVKCPYGAVGDRLWVKERYTINGDRTYYETESDGTVFIAYHAAMFMPRSRSRITLEITAVRVQRLQDICDDDIAAEGVDLFREGTRKRVGTAFWLDRFETLWDDINGKKHPWSSNPWVWAITFKRIKS